MSKQEYNPLTCTLQSTYKERCPYPAWQLVIALDIFGWAHQQCLNNGTIPMNVTLGEPIDAINACLHNAILDELHFVRLQDYDDDELEYELKRRKGEL